MNGPAILWPVLGHPLGIFASREDEGQELVVLLASSERPDPRVVSGRLRSLNGGREADLRCVSSTTVTLEESGVNGRFADSVRRRSPVVHRLTLRSPAPWNLPGGSTQLCDLSLEVGGTGLQRPGSVFLVDRFHAPLRAFVATDVHVAARWDEFAGDVQRLFPARRGGGAVAEFSVDEAFSSDCFNASYVNPNRNIAELVRQANRLHREGLLDALFLTGDLVDYKYRAGRGECGEEDEDTEWRLLERLLLGEIEGAERLLVPLFTSTGNHDYRLRPYELQIYGARHCAIPDAFTHEYLRRRGLWRQVPYRLRDLDAIRIAGEPRPSLEPYYRIFNPCDDWTLDWGALRVVALDTGPDYFCQPGGVFSRRWRRFLSGFGAPSDPYSNGFSSEQVRYLRARLEERPRSAALVLAHAPLVNPDAAFAIGSGRREEELPVRLEDADRSAIEFEERLRHHRLDVGAVFRNQLAFLSALRSHPSPVVMASGHNHWLVEVALDNVTGRLSAGSFSAGMKTAPAPAKTLLLQTPALGHVKREDLRLGIPAFRSLEFDGARIISFEVVALGSAPFESWSYEWSAADAGDGTERVELFFLKHDESPVGVVHRVVCLLQPESPGGMPVIRVLEVDALMSEGGGVRFRSFVVRDVARLTLQVVGRRPRTRIGFLFETVVPSGDGSRSLGLRWHHRELAGRLAKIQVPG